jgi:hypothetical protein
MRSVRKGIFVVARGQGAHKVSLILFLFNFFLVKSHWFCVVFIFTYKYILRIIRFEKSWYRKQINFFGNDKFIIN